MPYKKLLGLVTALVVVSSGLYAFTTEHLPVAQGEEVIAGPADLKGRQNVAASPYFIKHDFYNMESKGGLTILSHFPTLQQTTEYSCGPAAALMVLKYFAPQEAVTEQELCQVMSTSKVVGTNTKGMVQYFAPDKWQVESSLTHKTPSTDEEFKEFVVQHLRSKMPIMVENVDWGGHWRVIIGYDDMGTAQVGDDVLILADPYDTTDHQQDGYNITSAQRFFYMWFDAKLFTKGAQDKQWLSVKPKKM